MDRRNFLQILGLFSSATVLSSCGSQDGQKKLISYLVPPEDGVLPGQARWQSSTCTECPAGCGLAVRIREERPVKLEGLPEHPVSRGGLCVRGQASLWRLYHPQRLRQPMRRDEQGRLWPIGWDEVYRLISEGLARARAAGRGSAYLADRTTGTLSELIERFCRELDIERLPEFELYAHAALRKANRELFGIDDVPLYRIDQADLLISLGADLLETFVSPVDQASRLAGARTADDFRWYHLEPHMSLTGSNADRRLVLNPGSETVLLTFLLRRLEASGRARRRLPEAILAALPAPALAEVAAATGLKAAVITELAEALAAAETPLLIAGGAATARPGGLGPAVLAALVQWSAGMIGRTVDFGRRQNYPGVGTLIDLETLNRRLGEEAIGVLFVSRANPLALLGPAALADNLPRAELRIGLTDFVDETAGALDLLLPLSHALESWGDREPQQGVRTLLKPAIPPLHDTRSEGDILLQLLEAAGRQKIAGSYQEFLFASWESRYGRETLERFAATGFVAEPVREPAVDLNPAAAARLWAEAAGAGIARGPVLLITPSLRTYDGRSKLIPLLAEIPDPLTTISYGAWLSIGPARAARLGVGDRDRLRLAHGGQGLLLPAKLQPGLAEAVATVQIDQLPQPVRSHDPASGEAVLLLARPGIEKAGGAAELPILAGSTSQQGRGLIPDPVHRDAPKEHPQASLYPQHPHPDYRWAMAIDLRRCIGCSACVAACYIENSVPVVGRADHLKGREMSWLRIEPYYDEEGRADFLPMLCQHCHSAPCEPVCPVYAAYHNVEGLNVQVYARCVGTRYCSNNCPYKVRRFNWWDHRRPEPLDQMVNPDLVVRSRGIMEKCTFCIQRIRAARDTAKDEGRKIRDGELTTACAQSCPTGAIVFGNLLDEQSEVYRWAHSKRAYRVFEELGTQSSIYYLKP